MSPLSPSAGRFSLPGNENDAEFTVGRRKLRLTNLQKLVWPELHITKRDLLQYYVDLAPALLPHLRGRAVLMKRYPNGAAGEFFLMKRAPARRPDWVQVCPIPQEAGNDIDFAVIQDLATLLWVINLGCIDLQPWDARCDDLNRPDYLHFDLNPVGSTSFARVRETALRVRDALREMNISSYPKTSGARGIHIYVPIKRGPLQKQVWAFGKGIAQHLEERYPRLLTAEHRISRRPDGHVLVDYNQNAWGRTLASAYSVRASPHATVSTPVTWEEIERGIRPEEFRLDTLPDRIRDLGDLWKPMEAARGRLPLERFL